ncbi:LacI family DNA-binding transcriptional regulator [Ramlibacter tataouinensis]|uniref:LacI family DNA-binding transcriptional regulator n=1 Tax=Ramlibacter tataouinensis TaxID=94132 RepID=UPI0022F393EA|nr:LacI family DNA-binding transcriptional regulator [Ramlibacter tataouinensis]WBY03165.1 LacI family DNA-binding transcriptional regulator [Ramlibacter tataouinensis]
MKSSSPLANLPEPVGIREIARESGVSIATVSRVLQGNARVSGDLKAKVEEVVRRLNYRPNFSARTLRMQKSHTVGVVVPHIGNAHFSDAVRAIQDVASDEGYTALVVNSDGEPAQEVAALRTLEERQVDGIVLVSSSPTATKALSSTIERGVPVLAMDRAIRGAGMDQVLVNTRAGTREAVLHLAANRCRRIALLAGPSGLWTASEKFKGYLEGLKEAGLEFDPDLVLPGDYSFESGENQALALLDLKPRPDGLIVANNLMTLGAMRVFLRHRVDIPDELALVGYDDALWTDVVRPAVTVVSQPTYELGASSIRTLLARLANRSAEPKRVLLDTRLIVRESSARVSGKP